MFRDIKYDTYLSSERKLLLREFKMKAIFNYIHKPKKGKLNTNRYKAMRILDVIFKLTEGYF